MGYEMSKIFDEVLEESQDEFAEFKYSSIDNLDQFNEGLDYLINQIEIIEEIIDWATGESLILSGVLKEGEEPARKIWETAKRRIKLQQDKVSSVKKLLLEFLGNNSVQKNGRNFEITLENCINSKTIVNNFSHNVEDITQKYYENTRNIKKIPYPLDDSVRLYNNSVESFNIVLNQYRTRFDITAQTLPDANKAVI